jgi:hypothetical protein
MPSIFRAYTILWSQHDGGVNSLRARSRDMQWIVLQKDPRGGLVELATRVRQRDGRHMDGWMAEWPKRVF